MLAYARGSKVQFRRKSSASDPHAWFGGVAISFNWSDYDYRIKQEPKLRDWKPEEVPLYCMFKKGERIRLNLGVTSTGVLMAHSESFPVCVYSFDCLRLEYVHSRDGGATWHPCGVLET